MSKEFTTVTWKVIDKDEPVKWFIMENKPFGKQLSELFDTRQEAELNQTLIESKQRELWQQSLQIISA